MGDAHDLVRAIKLQGAAVLASLSGDRTRTPTARTVVSIAAAIIESGGPGLFLQVQAEQRLGEQGQFADQAVDGDPTGDGRGRDATGV